MTRQLDILLFLTVASVLFLPLVTAGELPLILKDDFERGAERWEPLDPKQWKIKPTDKGNVFSLHEKKGTYKPPHRSPVNICLLKDVTLGDCEITARVLSTHPDYGHRDSVIVFGYQDPAHFYYVHLATKADDHANQIFIVNGEARKKISLTTTEGTRWDDDWHTLRVVRNAKSGSIDIFFDDMKKPVMTVKDVTFPSGRLGIGSFDDTSDWDDIEIRGQEVKRP